MDRIKAGKDAEQSARKFLEKKRLTFITSNFHSRWGEIDLIMQDGKELVFIEVRARSHNSHGGAAQSVDTRKQSKLIKTAQFYLQKHSATAFCRFDVIAIEGNAATTEPIWYKDAFRI